MTDYIEREALLDALCYDDAITMGGIAIINQFPAAKESGAEACILM